MDEARYTKIWFDLLADNGARIRTGNLAPDTLLACGKYTVGQMLESGGQANIYSAFCDHGSPVVIKEYILADDYESLVESARDFENESSILAQLQHPGVVKMLDIFAEDRRVYIVLEQVQGTNLRRLVREEGPRPPAEAVQLGIKMCEILNYLHAQQPPVVHRDFTPDNIIIKPDGSLVLIDFSVASHRKQYAGDCVGKHAYTAPDQFRGQSCPQSDLYALGATIYYLLVGSDPVPLSVSHPQQKRADVPAALDSIVARATALKLADRYESAEWLRLDLAKLATGVESGSAGSVQAAVDKELTEGTVISLPDPV